MEFLNRMTEAIEYIEDHITDDFAMDDLAKIVYCSAYQFSRIFSYVVGISISEYIRKRRLSLAALELQNSKSKVIDIALKYGYNSPESFTRAFREMQGITPREACAHGVRLRLYPRLTFQISIKGALNMEYRIEEKGIIKGVGLVKNFGKVTVNSEADHWKDRGGEVWKFWDEYLNGGTDEIVAKYRLYRAPFFQMGVSYTDDNGNLSVFIGAEDDGACHAELTEFEIPASTWAVFTARGSLSQKVHPIEALTTQIFSEWFPSSNYKKAMDYEIEVYGPGNTEDDDYVCEIWIPIKSK